jgi:DNA-binding transcriptional LysR family regulator
MKLVAFAAKGHSTAKKRELTLSDLEHIPLIVRMDTDLHSTTHTVLNSLRKQGYKLNIAMRCESPEAVQGAVAQKLGIGMLYYDAVKSAIERGSFKIVPIRGLEIEGQTYIVHHKERPLSPHAEEFLKLLREWRDQQNTKSVHSGAQTKPTTSALAARALL